MQKSNWLDFLSGKLKAQISLETAEKTHLWGLALVALFSLGFAFNILADAAQTFLFGSKILFLFFFHVVLVFGFYLPSILQKGESAVSRFLGIRDFSSLVLISSALTFYLTLVLIVSLQMAAGAGQTRMSNFYLFVNWANVAVSSLYVLGSAFFFLSLFFFPNALTRIFEKAGRMTYVLAGVHAAFAVLFGFSYSEMYAIGGPAFFSQFKLAGLFWIFMTCSVLYLGRLMRQSVLPSLSALEFEVASGRLERNEDILARFKDVFVLSRFSSWLNRLSRDVATRSHQIAQYTHDAVQLVSQDRPVEAELIKVEDSYKRGESLFKKLNKASQKFLLSVSFFNLTESEREKVESLRNQYSKEIRNAKLELSSVRQKIDEKLVALKNKEKAPSPAISDIPVERVPLSR